MEQKLIFVVDDEMAIREMEQTYLESEGYMVETFATADDAIEAMENGDRTPDLLLMDIMMPGTDGLSACGKIRRSEKLTLRLMPIILVSARDTALDKVTGLTIGCDDYLAKPFLPLELLARVKALLRRSEMLMSGLKKVEDGEMSDEEIKVAIGEDLFYEIYRGGSSQNVGRNIDNCGNLYLDRKAHRIYVDQNAKNTQLSEDIKGKNVDKESIGIKAKSLIKNKKILDILEKGSNVRGNEGYTLKTAKEGMKNDPDIDPYGESSGRDSKEDHDNSVKIIDLQVTPMEFEFVQYLMLRKETAVPKTELLTEIWHLPDAELKDGVRMTDDLVKRLRKKMATAGSTAKVKTVWGYGYRLTEN